MKILLIYPYSLEPRMQEDDISVVPIGLYYIGAILKEHGYSVEIVNGHTIDRTPDKIEELIREMAPGIIGFSVLNSNRWGAVEIARIAKKINPSVKVVFGGVAATFLWRHFLNNFKEIDFIVTGEGEHTFFELVQAVEQDAYDSLRNIRGLAFWRNNEIVHTGEARRVLSLDDLPNPAKFFTYQHLSSSRGCHGNCTFCGAPKFWGRRIRHHSPEVFVDQLEMLYKKGVTFFYVSDDTFTFSKKRVIEICGLIIERKMNINWFAISRVDCIDEEIVRWMRKAGCIQISYGVESGSEKIRHVLGKRTTEEDIRSAFKITRRYGILPRAYFIYGSPGESWETIQDTLDLMKEIKPLGALFYILEMFPGNMLYEEYCRKNGIGDDVWLQKIEAIQYFEVDANLPAGSIIEFGRKLRNEFHNSLPGFVDTLELLDDPEFFPYHADFCSRLGLTFSHGDLAHVATIPDPESVAEKLFRRALHYNQDHRAFLGLGALLQKKRKYEESVDILKQGHRSFPESEQLAACLGISYMNLRKWRRALDCFLPFQYSQTIKRHMAECYGKLGNKDKASEILHHRQSG